MTYTINTLAKMSGVSIRTLRFYDEIGLLKPAYVGENGYRYYQEEQLLVLQQILFYKELELDLKQIKNILNRSDFDKKNALQSHKILLREKEQRIQTLIETIDKTINHLEGKAIMNIPDLYTGFHETRKKIYAEFTQEYEKNWDKNISAEEQAQFHKQMMQKISIKLKKASEDFAQQYGGEAGRKQFEECFNKAKNLTKEDWEKFNLDTKNILSAFSDAIKKGLKANSDQVQQIMYEFDEITQRIYITTKDYYEKELEKSIKSSPYVKEFYAGYHPDLAQFLIDAAKIFAEKK